MCCLYCSFLLMLFPSYCGVSPTADSPSQTAPAGSFPQNAVLQEQTAPMQCLHGPQVLPQNLPGACSSMASSVGCSVDMCSESPTVLRSTGYREAISITVVFSANSDPAPGAPISSFLSDLQGCFTFSYSSLTAAVHFFLLFLEHVVTEVPRILLMVSGLARVSPSWR